MEDHPLTARLKVSVLMTIPHFTSIALLDGLKFLFLAALRLDQSNMFGRDPGRYRTRPLVFCCSSASASLPRAVD
jgi:hypothetical protein